MASFTDEESALRPVIRELLSSVTVGFGIAAVLYGITLVQMFLYFRRYPTDTAFLKATVALLCVLDTFATALIAHSLFTYIVVNYWTPAKDLVIPWSFATENGVTTLITFIVQCYFAECLWRFTRGNKTLVVSIVLLAVASLGLGSEATIRIFVDSTAESLATKKVRIIGGFAQGTAAICDVMITWGLCYYLDARRSKINSTNTIIDRLMLYAIQRGALTSITQIFFLITFVAFPGSAFIPLQTATSKLYVNGLLATLNVRHTLKSDRCGDEAIDVELKQTSFTINTIRSPGSGVSTDLAESKVGPPSSRDLRQETTISLESEPSGKSAVLLA
ncbi:hypothetical protein VTO73DRAFT_3531 [Trametes versicolor]